MYTETDVSDAEDLYGRTKYLGEVNEKGCITIRSSIIGKEVTGQKGLLEWFLSNKGGSVHGFTNAIYSGFTVIEMSRIVDFIIKNHLGLSGVWQVASEPISKYDLLNIINLKLRLGITIHADDSYPCDRSLNAERFHKKTGYVPPSWDEMIDELSKEVI
jgi:dTDP-4-dehydrorhamnose reductase